MNVAGGQERSTEPVWRTFQPRATRPDSLPWPGRRSRARACVCVRLLIDFQKLISPNKPPRVYMFGVSSVRVVCPPPPIDGGIIIIREGVHTHTHMTNTPNRDAV